MPNCLSISPEYIAYVMKDPKITRFLKTARPVGNFANLSVCHSLDMFAYKLVEDFVPDTYPKQYPMLLLDIKVRCLQPQEDTRAWMYLGYIYSQLLGATDIREHNESLGIHALGILVLLGIAGNLSMWVQDIAEAPVNEQQWADYLEGLAPILNSLIADYQKVLELLNRAGLYRVKLIPLGETIDDKIGEFGFDIKLI